jgi:hypothetical protein
LALCWHRAEENGGPAQLNLGRPPASVNL